MGHCSSGYVNMSSKAFFLRSWNSVMLIELKFDGQQLQTHSGPIPLPPCLFFFFSFYHKILLLSIKVVSLQTRDNGWFLAKLFWAALWGMSGLSLEGCPEATWRHNLLSVPTMVNLRAQPQGQREGCSQTRHDQPPCQNVAIYPS